MRIRWLGHAAFEISEGEKVVLVDPWLRGNPLAAAKPEDFEKVDVIVVTHDHQDHLGDAVEIAKKTGALVVAVPELAAYVEELGASAQGQNMGSFADARGVEVALVQAFHTCSRGAPAGALVRMGGKTVYHMGDTSLFGDVALIGELYKPDVALVPIGGFYVMGPLEAAKAVELMKPKVSVPMHYATFPVLEKSPDRFVEEVSKRAPEVKVVVLKPGESLEV